MDLYPAIDLRAGRCVRLYQGDYGRETAYGTDPVTVARSFAAAGARWIHVVDLDAARTGVPENADAIAAIARAVAPAVGVQAGGGVRDQTTAETLWAAGVSRVVLGTAAVENPALVRELAAEHPVVVGVDVRDGDVAVRGWTEGSGRRLVDVLAGFDGAGLAAVVVTEIARDGTLAGPDLELFATALEATATDVIASGGVGSLADLEALASLEAGGRRLAGAIVGKALYEGVFTVEEAVAACAASG
ncbi:MAG TPA: 1-(5-phosphoribosyl)-5-[(5-phosphoribosylamino)methylideneamino]imidazole-4-carboxamide isomerase [Acidimicrobiales bacterium]|nr:1-(5-phosphoribosyl)-5-[(5-phosphoribosylamino)methylideneamino]imidazole-4-carboxamide isomerase [Acidimicrobiales bacterium]